MRELMARIKANLRKFEAGSTNTESNVSAKETKKMKIGDLSIDLDKFEVKVKDEAGNEATYNSPYFYVDQHKPTLDVTSPADLSLKKQNDALTVSGSTSDNFNGEIDKVVVKVTHPNYNQSQLDQFTKTFTKDGSNGTQLLTQIGSDEKYSFEYTWDESNSPFKFPNEYEVSILTYDKAGNETPVTRKVSCDSTAPTISFSRPYSYSVDAIPFQSPSTVSL